MSVTGGNGEEEEEVKKFLLWFQQHGGRFCPFFQYERDAIMGLSIFSTCDLGPDTEAISVPKICCITASLAKRQILALIGQSEAVIDDNLTGKEYKLSQSASNTPPRKRHKTEKSALESHLLHLPYVQLLPEETLTPLHYNREELHLLSSTPLFGHAVESRANGRKSCIKAVEWLHSNRQRATSSDEQLNEVFQMLEVPQGIRSKDENDVKTEIDRQAQDWGIDEDQWPILKEWRWAETAYGSRAFPPRLLGEEDTTPVLIPGLDSFNHSRKAKVTWTWNKESIEHITLTLHQSLQKDKQVFNTYGPKSNEELIASYGFVNEEMDDDVVTFKLGGQQKKMIAHQHYWRYKEDCPISLLEEVKAVLRQPAQHHDEKIESDSGNEDSELMLEGDAMDTIASLLEGKIATFEAAQRNVEEALKKGKSMRDSVRNCIAVYRCSQIRIMHSALEQVQRRLDEVQATLEGNIFVDDTNITNSNE